ncbi:AfsR/SARP family transcriptional regulator [Phytohabitans aurantiacus]|uniref:Bacterial transcriptional activator domain-containing protein n=1 Tax=Phytohabitans aurantiacus TaxID=3016789 RepID=A0ABQ5RBD2_9ACTN|nr:tetratricopeptide repeat protein [Phytohabitans aurantiacus]GLI02901.1 hypothetical protein Pa4123_81790 [Phytohabitans aurantiacus]
MVEIRILGEVVLDGPRGPVVPQRVGERLLLAALAIEVGRVVPVQRLLDLIGESGDIATGTLVDYVSAVRRALTAAGGSRAMLPNARRSGAYILDVDPEHVDYQRHRKLVAAARAHAVAGEHAAAVEVYEQALALWTASPLANVRGGGDGLRQRLHEERHTTVHELLTQQLHAGDHLRTHTTVARLLHEEVPTDQMIVLGLHALARAGRHADIPALLSRAAERMHAMVGARPGQQVHQLAQRLLSAPGQSLTLLPTESAPQSGPRRAARFTLPADPIAFTGRTQELGAITATVTNAAQRGGVLAIHAIDGMPGVGKSTLAIHAAHQLTERFPDRQVFVDLHAHSFDQPPTAPTDALADLLIADGVDPRQLPDSLDGRASMWRDRLANSRTLILLDNAASTAQISPLVPGTPGCLVLITSRRRLADLTATHLYLDTLPADDAITMFLRLAPRASGQVDAVKAVVEVCGYLPLAIAITARLYSRRPSWTVPQLVAEIRGRRLTAAGEHHTVKAAFDLSYHHLPESRQRFFRLLGLHPGVDIDGYAAAALTGVPYEQALRELDDLYNDHLLEEPSYRRYRMHDLIRDYSHTLATTQDPPKVREQAIKRLLDYYHDTAARADKRLTRYTRPAAAPATASAAAPDLDDWDEAATWLRTERLNLLACVHHTTTHQSHPHTVGLTAGIAALLHTDGPWSLAADLHHAAATAAHARGDRHAHANALHDLGVLRWLVGDYPYADGLLGRAQNLYQALDDRLGQANTLYELGIVRRLTGDYAAARTLLRQALDLYRIVDDRLGQANTLHELGVACWLVGKYPSAVDLLRRALSLYRALDDRGGLANTLHELGFVRRLTCDYQGATDLLGQARVNYQSLDDRRGQANTLRELGIIRRLTGDYPGAADLLEQALNTHRTIGNRRGEAITMRELGILRRLTGDLAGGADLSDQALTLCRALGDRHGEALSLSEMGLLRHLAGDLSGANDLLGQARALFRTIGSPPCEAKVLTRLGAVRYLTGDYHHARDLLQRAVAMLREAGALDDESEALNHLGTLHRLIEQPDQARALHHQALAIARDIHLPVEEARALEGLG